MAAQRTPRVYKTKGGPAKRSIAIVKGFGYPVWSIVFFYQQFKEDRAKVLQVYDDLDESLLEEVLDYYETHREEIDLEISMAQPDDEFAKGHANSIVDFQRKGVYHSGMTSTRKGGTHVEAQRLPRTTVL